ncbi:bacterial Ig-like domain-containing protein [Enterococcus mundtii]|uniref:Ig-like domain-containing protein n=2 Tax=Enterococcus mundtii TaxID=53346 RepID=A0A1V2UER8_ENTMU|nr:bacterial Ig-like domain-containing protein [Enterococcus mundtii]ONN41818.1 hypothetical protein BTN92_11695 [Enterococcus mundtii]
MKKKLTSVLLVSLLFQMSLPALSYAQETNQIKQTPTSSQTKEDSSNTWDSNKKEIASTVYSNQSGEEASTNESTESTPSSIETTVPSVSLPEVQQPQPKAGETKADPPLTLPPGYDVGKEDDKAIRQTNEDTLTLRWQSRKSTGDGYIPVFSNKRGSYLTNYGKSLGLNLLINKELTLGNGGAYKEIFSSGQSASPDKKIFGHAPDGLYQAFYFDDVKNNHFKFQVEQFFLADDSVRVKYTLTNLNSLTLKIGLMQYMGVQLSSSSSGSIPVAPLNGFKGAILIDKNVPSFVFLPKTFDNWTAGEIENASPFNGYTPATADGKGWESGLKNGDANFPIQENVPIVFRHTRLNMKSAGRDVVPNGTISFEVDIKGNKNIDPELLIDRSDITINEDNDAMITGQAWDDDTEEFKVAIVNKTTNEVISSQEFTGVTLGDKQPFQLTVPADKLMVGKNEFIARVSDKWGAKKEVPVTVNVIEGQAEPSIDLSAVYQPFQSEDTTVPLNDQDDVYNRKLVTYTFKVDNTGKVDLTNSQLKALLPSSSTYVPDSTTLNDVPVADVNKESPLITGVKVNSPGAGDGIVQPSKPAVVKMKVKVDGNPGDSLMQEGTLTGDNFTGANAVISPAITNKVKENKSAIHLKNVTVPTNSQWTPKDNFVSATDEEGKDLPFSTFTPQNNVDLSTPGTYWVQFNYDDLVVKADVTVIPATLEFVVPDTMDFQEAAISGQKQYVPRVDPDWTITVNNTLHTDWKVTAQATPMVGGGGTTYKDALVYKDNTSETSLSATTVIATGDSSQETTEMKWSKDQGILFAVDPTVMKKDSYQGTIEWTLEQAP